MKKINIASLVIAFIIFILLYLDYNLGPTRILLSVGMFWFLLNNMGVIDDGILYFLWDNFLFMVLIISSLGYLITFGLLSVIQRYEKVIMNLFK